MCRYFLDLDSGLSILLSSVIAIARIRKWQSQMRQWRRRTFRHFQYANFNRIWTKHIIVFLHYKIIVVQIILLLYSRNLVNILSRFIKYNTSTIIPCRVISKWFSNCVEEANASPHKSSDMVLSNFRIR